MTYLINCLLLFFFASVNYSINTITSGKRLRDSTAFYAALASSFFIGVYYVFFYNPLIINRETLFALLGLSFMILVLSFILKFNLLDLREKAAKLDIQIGQKTFDTLLQANNFIVSQALCFMAFLYQALRIFIMGNMR
jgi:hypothetical protein